MQVQHLCQSDGPAQRHPRPCEPLACEFVPYDKQQCLEHVKASNVRLVFVSLAQLHMFPCDVVAGLLHMCVFRRDCCAYQGNRIVETANRRRAGILCELCIEASHTQDGHGGVENFEIVAMPASISPDQTPRQFQPYSSAISCNGTSSSPWLLWDGEGRAKSWWPGLTSVNGPHNSIDVCSDSGVGSISGMGGTTDVLKKTMDSTSDSQSGSSQLCSPTKVAA